MLKENVDQSNVSIGAETENIHFGVFRKLAMGILNISKYLSRTCRRRKKNPKQQKLLRANREPHSQINSFRVKY